MIDNSIESYLNPILDCSNSTDLQLSCDNYGGQNKNRYVLWSLLYTTIVRRFKTVTLHFMISGHKKPCRRSFWCFQEKTGQN